MTDNPNSLPALAVSGHRGAGKTTLLEGLVQRWSARGLRVAWVKETEKEIEVDRAGKDSERLFRAGATVAMGSAGELFTREHPCVQSGRPATVRQLAASHDAVLVEGGKHLPLPKVWLAREGEPDPPEDVESVLATLPWGEDRLEALLEIAESWLTGTWRRRRVLGGVLIGGASRRMGQPKHLMEVGGQTLLARTVEALAPHCESTAVLGSGALPPSMTDAIRLPDVLDARGPLAGIVAAMRWAPDAAWVIAACDHPRITPEGIEWLVSQREPGAWTVQPRLMGGRTEPLLAVYEPQIRPAAERLAAGAGAGPSRLGSHPKAKTPTPPDSHRACWRDADTPGALSDSTEIPRAR